MIYVIGDSHTRSFAYNANFFPLFIGAGKENNFVSVENFKNLQNNIFNVLSKITDLNYVFFVLGEPDARFFSGQGWYPWDSLHLPNITGYKDKVYTSILRYNEMLNELMAMLNFNPIIFNVSPSKRIEQNIIVDFYNSCLEKMCKENKIPFVFINDKIYSDNKSIIHEIYFGDTVHLNNKIQPLVEDELIQLNIISESHYNQNLNWIHQEVMKQFSYDPKFGCFKQTNN